MKSGRFVGGRRVWLHAGAVVTLASTVMIAGGTGRVGAQGPVCGLQTLHGSYVFAASGYNIAGAVALPKAIVELIEFNGDGTLAVSGGTLSINGNIIPIQPGAGLYTLDADCKGTVTFTMGPSFDIFIRAGNKEGRMIQTTPGTVFQGTLTRDTP